MPIPHKNVLDEAVKIIHFLKSRPLSTTLFTILCEDMGSTHKSLLYHTEEYLESIDGNIEDFDEIHGEIEQHLNEILSSLEKYFPESKDIEFIQRYNWVKNPFLINDKPENLSITEYEEFIEMTTDSSLKTLFDKISLTDFWCSSSITKEY
ncbi:Hypothetical protein CINCED_3A005081 [Cinara cedri]|uniref:Uncharacterized protein n=1 Tax=Cinara cedri TaxID=506608 RepID=A0A5E4NBA8_9HEMI|nr:Hypothetical protein CINCED_3A005081 [Cinara cedri]